MNGIDWIVIGVAAAAIAWVIWYFFMESGDGAVAASSAGRQTIEIVVDGGYDPKTVRAKAGVPLTLVFDRRDNSPCSEEIVIGAFGIRQFLPTGQKTAVEIPPAKPGKYDFTCGMSMLHGALVVE